MKKLFFPFLALLFLIACEKESTTDVLPKEELHGIEGDALLRRTQKIDVCHYDAENNTWHVINISENAWPAHAGHGDVRLDDQDDDGYVPDNGCDYGQQGDCNDTNAAVNPGATEICDGQGIDEDCDGDVDEADSDCSTSCAPEELGEELEVTVNGPSGSYTLYVYPVDNSLGSLGIPWSNTFTNTGATDNWDGDANTDAIVLDQGDGTSYAAGLCASLKTDGCDWYLPARNELNAMYQQLGRTNNGFDGSGDMTNGFYWSSTEDDGDNVAAWLQNFGNGDQFTVSKNTVFRCRCVRR